MRIAPYAVQLATCRGRLYKEEEHAARSPWQRDRDRVIHSSSFRTLQYKTQVFVNHEGDFFRTRLTHTLEVAQVARSVARYLQLDEDLTEAVALAHDLGHTPFGHAGEEAMKSALKTCGGFDHNTQSLRVVVKLERRYIPFNGLNLTWETLEGLAKHNGPVDHPTRFLAEYDKIHPLELNTFASAEAQVAAIADDIAYHGHDLDDGLRAGLLTFEDVEELPIVGDALREVRILLNADTSAAHTRRDKFQRLRHETIRRVINTLVSDLTRQTKRNIEALDPHSSDDIRYASKPVVGFSDKIAEANLEIRKFLYARMYRHWRVMRMTAKARRLLAELFEILSQDITLLPDGWRESAIEAEKIAGIAGSSRVVADYIAGMTDRFAMEEHRKLTDMTALV